MQGGSCGAGRRRRGERSPDQRDRLIGDDDDEIAPAPSRTTGGARQARREGADRPRERRRSRESMRVAASEPRHDLHPTFETPEPFWPAAVGEDDSAWTPEKPAPVRCRGFLGLLVLAPPPGGACLLALLLVTRGGPGEEERGGAPLQVSNMASARRRVWAPAPASSR